MSKDPFSFSEWLFVGLVLGCLITISWFSFLNSPSFSPQWIVPQKMEVKVEGAVKNPGTYSVYTNTLLKKILAKAKPLKSADLQAFSGQKRIAQSCILVIPYKKEIEVFVTGAVKNPGKFILPYGASYASLLSQLELKEGANPKKTRKTKILKDQGEIIIPWS